MTRTISRHIMALANFAILMIGQASAAAPTAFTLLHGLPKTLSPSAAASADRSATLGKVSADEKTVAFSQKTVRLVAHSGPASDMLSYRIDGLRNPTLVVPAGAVLNVLFVNTDADMPHDLRFGTQHTVAAPSAGTPALAHQTATVFHAMDVTLQVPPKPGTYYYFCTIPGHAQGGMWGTLRVR